MFMIQKNIGLNNYKFPIERKGASTYYEQNAIKQ